MIYVLSFLPQQSLHNTQYVLLILKVWARKFIYKNHDGCWRRHSTCQNGQSFPTFSLPSKHDSQESGSLHNSSGKYFWKKKKIQVTIKYLLKQYEFWKSIYTKDILMQFEFTSIGVLKIRNIDTCEKCVVLNNLKFKILSD